ncbi:hypothetical protein GCM10009564_52640 [Streptomyces thermogriseus]|uniref:Uncharacterized protein n=1 Tax=Streptomyces thermogriseus TaxID=75292 RepID=A0ABP4DS37_9ACTN
MPHVGGDGAAGGDIGDPGGAAPDLVAVPYLGEQARYPGAVDVFEGGVQRRAIQWVLHVMRPFVFSGVSSASAACPGQQGTSGMPALRHAHALIMHAVRA